MANIRHLKREGTQIPNGCHFFWPALFTKQQRDNWSLWRSAFLTDNLSVVYGICSVDRYRYFKDSRASLCRRAQQHVLEGSGLI